MNPLATNLPAARRAGRGLAVLASCLALLATARVSPAVSVAVPNASFESPVTTYANPPVDSWQKTPKPPWFVEGAPFYWDQEVGTFRNPSPGYPDRIDNCDGQQALWIFAVPEAGLFQDYDSRDWNDPAPTHAFNVTFQPGKSYRLTVGVIGGGGGMLPGVPLELSLYYRDAAARQVPVASQIITNDIALFPSTTRFVDFSVMVPAVRASDPWAGQKLGIRILSLVSQEMQGGYWDVDNVRLTETAAPELSSLAKAGSNQFQLTLRGEPGQVCEVLTATDPALPVSAWTSIRTVTNHTGLTGLLVPATNGRAQFYQARALP